MKVKAVDIKAGDIIMIGKKRAIVTSNIIVPVEIKRTVDTSVMSYRFDNEEESDDETVNRDRHFNGGDKVEFIPPKKGWIETILGRWHEDEKPKKSTKNKEVPFFVKS